MLEDLDQLISLGYISKKKHPSEDLFILNYTPKTQYEALWNETTMSCRGLIVDSKNNIVARCFKKFFNYEEVKGDVDARLEKNLPFSMVEKMDGSLGILYWLNGSPFIATRGSFDSDQAVKANQILSFKPTDSLDRSLTYLFEIIYPSNRICVDYGSLEDLVLLSVIHNESGEELEVLNHPFVEAERIDPDPDFSSVKSKNLPNKEGFVVRFSDGFRFKIKFEEYVRIHSLVFSLSSKSIWRCLKNGESLPLDSIPDEIYDWAKGEKVQIKKSYDLIVKDALSIFSSISHLPRKEFASEALKHRYSSLLFSMLDGKPYEDLVWRMVEPEYRTPFKNEKIQEDT